MKTIEESVVTALDGTSIEIYPFLPYILQDFFELGSDSEIIIEIIKRHFNKFNRLRVLDLGCGKGSVSINISKILKCKCYGIDALPEFIKIAKQKAKENKVENLCNFEIGDIRKKIKQLTEYDIILLGSIGPVLGNYYETLTSISQCLKQTGMIIIDDGYIDDKSDFTHPLILKQKDILNQIKDANMKIIENNVINFEKYKNDNNNDFNNLKKRCNELISKYPNKKNIFEDYVQNQKKEYDVLENKIVCTTMVIKQK